MPTPVSDQELYSRLVLWRTAGIGPMSIRRLVEYFGSATEALKASGQALQEAGLKSTMIAALQTASHDAEQGAEVDQKWCSSSERRYILTPEHEHYPLMLRDIDTPPPLIFAVGNPRLLNDPQLAIIGSRNPSQGGRENARAFAVYLAEHGLCITSGLADGIDAECHQGALQVEGSTIAVVATGLDIVYPAQNRKLAERISESGLIISEFPIGTKPQPQNFPRRNRIISGMSVGTLVVEATLKSGSLVTAKHAMNQGREVFAIPGSIHNPMARGCHQLIRQGAKLVETAHDILEEVAPQLAHYLTDVPPTNRSSVKQNNNRSASQVPQQNQDWELDGEHHLILTTLGTEPLPIDQIIMKTGLTADVVSSILLMLELQGYAVACGGGHYMRQT